MERVVIIGNAGSGKSSLATRLGEFSGAPVFDLDQIHWLPGGYTARRPPGDALRLAGEVAAAPAWVIEGVYGWLAAPALPSATALIWLDLPWEICEAGIEARGRRGASEAGHATMVEWAKNYWTRDDSASFNGHQRLFERFPGAKLRFREQKEIEAFLADPSAERMAEANARTTAAGTEPPLAIVAADAPPRTKPSNYPEPFFSRMGKRVKRPLGDLFGLTNFGVNLTRLQPGGESALLHRHSKQDEFVYIVEGEATLVTDRGEATLTPGMVAGFPAGGVAHHLVNRTEADVVYLEIGDRTPGDEGSYPADDLEARFGDDGKWAFTRKDGTLY